MDLGPESVLQLDFEGVEASDNDINSMAKLLNQLVRESGVDAKRLAELLVSQNYIGSVLKPCMDDVDFDDGEDPEDQAVYAITSIVNLKNRQVFPTPVIEQVLDFLRKSVVEKKATVNKGAKLFEQIINENQIKEGVTLGLLVKERMINMPVDLLHPSILSLMSDIENAVAKKMPYQFTHLVYWSKLYLNDGTYIHTDAEDSWFEENSTGYFTYPLKDADTVMMEDDSDHPGAIQTRRVYLLEYSKLQSFLDYLKSASGQQ